MPCKCNKLYIGLIIGFTIPIITAYLIFYFRFHDVMGIKEFFERLIAVDGFTKLLSISVFPNLLFFLIAIKLDRLLAARGIVTSTLLYAIIVIVLKFVM